jgi:hypothetical protein
MARMVWVKVGLPFIVFMCGRSYHIMNQSQQGGISGAHKRTEEAGRFPGIFGVSTLFVLLVFFPLS